jgi:hypothetical protein
MLLLCCHHKHRSPTWGMVLFFIFHTAPGGDDHTPDGVQNENDSVQTDFFNSEARGETRWGKKLFM